MLEARPAGVNETVVLVLLLRLVVLFVVLSIIFLVFFLLVVLLVVLVDRDLVGGGAARLLGLGLIFSVARHKVSIGQALPSGSHVLTLVAALVTALSLPLSAVPFFFAAAALSSLSLSIIICRTLSAA